MGGVRVREFLIYQHSTHHLSRPGNVILDDTLGSKPVVNARPAGSQENIVVRDQTSFYRLRSYPIEVGAENRNPGEAEAEISLMILYLYRKSRLSLVVSYPSRIGPSVCYDLPWDPSKHLVCQGSVRGSSVYPSKAESSKPLAPSPEFPLNAMLGLFLSLLD